MKVDLALAERFVWRHARLLDRRLFERRFLGGTAEAVVTALRAYQNDDGGFGHALEPDLRGPDSQPIGFDTALRYLEGAGTAPPEMVGRACAFLESVSGPDGGVAAILPSVEKYDRSEHWAVANWRDDSLNPTGMIAGLLHALGVANAWLDRADAFCWRRLAESTDYDGPALAAVFCFLNHAPDRRRAVLFAEEVASRIPDALFFSLDPPEPGAGYALTPLDLAPSPDSMAASLFAPELLAAHLDALEAQQQPDGGWALTWEPPGPAAVLEWRGEWTVEALMTLQRYGRIDGGG